MSFPTAIENYLLGFRPLDTLTYLRSRGWKKQDEVRQKYSIWTRETEGGVFEVLVPADKRLSDLRKRVFELVETVRIAEGNRPFEQLVEDMMLPNTDILRTRLAPGSTDGSIPIEDGVAAFSKVRDLLLASACAAVDPKPVYSKRKFDNAVQYLKEARFGQTAKGSYVITVYSPLPPEIKSSQTSMLQEEEFGVPEPEMESYQRKVIRTLNQSLGATQDSITAYASSGDLDDEIYRYGVSANLCDAIVGLNERSGDLGVEFSFSWAAAQKKPEGVNDIFSFGTDTKPFLSQISTYYRQTAKQEDVSLIGVVHKLKRLSDTRGEITMVGQADGERKTVTTELDGEWHSAAVRAYDDKLPVECIGDIEKHGHGHIIRNPRDFRILE